MWRAVLLCLFLAACAEAPASRFLPVAVDGQDNALTLASRERVARGLRPLRPDPRLAAAARQQAVHMAARGRIGHDGPNGSTLRSRVEATGVSMCRMAENVAAGQPSAAEVHRAWMGSAGHRRNILDRKLDSGAAVAVEAGGVRWWAMVLGGSCGR
jgi:uncharacterized protein YkwD